MMHAKFAKDLGWIVFLAEKHLIIDSLEFHSKEGSNLTTVSFLKFVRDSPVGDLYFHLNR